MLRLSRNGRRGFAVDVVHSTRPWGGGGGEPSATGNNGAVASLGDTHSPVRLWCFEDTIAEEKSCDS